MTDMTENETTPDAKRSTDTPPSHSDDAKAPRQNKAPTPPQPSRDPKGTGHEISEGGLPEKQPTRKQQ